jgi:hypothetical protein
MRSPVRSWKFCAGVIFSVLAIFLAVGGTASAHANPQTPSSVTSTEVGYSSGLTGEQIDAAYNDLVASTMPRENIAVGDVKATKFMLPNGWFMTFVPKQTLLQPQLGGGWDGQHGLYVEFNRTDQSIIAGGGGPGLGGALCFLPGVGPALCIVALAVCGAAGAAIATHGFCPNILRIYAQLLGYSECR